VSEHPFELQARACDGLGSPFTAQLCRLLVKILDDKTATGRKTIAWPGDSRADALALRLAGALHALVLACRDAELAAVYPPNTATPVAIGEAVAGAIRRHDAFVVDFLANAPQTNEIARSAMLLPGFLTVARKTGMPLDVAEIGSSAGLNLNLDRFAVRYGRVAVGPSDSGVRLAPDIHAMPPLDGRLEIVRRAGCDIAPVDIADRQARLRLRAYLWADQHHRMERLDAALAIAQAHPVAVERADAVDFVRRWLARRRSGAAGVLFHSIMWQYMPQPSRDDILAMLEDAGGRADPTMPLAHLRMEPLGGPDDCATLILTSWPGGETRHLARCDFHGRWIEWIG
jgi:hypothetical protein